ncbi:MAG: DUF2934 domain-containing protein [Sedimentisphaerales bacterium]|nr:DUF2934 domain-containing protein [Sedimentisphaerales bacterium]
MSKNKNKMKPPQVFAAPQPKPAPLSGSQQPKTAQISAPQPIHDIPHPGPVASTTPTHDDIARRAYQIYVEKGCPQDQSNQIWQQAEQECLHRGLTKLLSK